MWCILATLQHVYLDMFVYLSLPFPFSSPMFLQSFSLAARGKNVSIKCGTRISPTKLCNTWNILEYINGPVAWLPLLIRCHSSVTAIDVFSFYTCSEIYWNIWNIFLKFYIYWYWCFVYCVHLLCPSACLAWHVCLPS